MSFVFYLLAALTIAGGLAAVLLKNTVHCALSLTVAFAGLALLYLELDAQFAGFAQILVYIGAVAILVVFAILLTKGSETPKDGVYSKNWFVGLVIAARRRPATSNWTSAHGDGVADWQCAHGPLRAPAGDCGVAADRRTDWRGDCGHARERERKMNPLTGYLLVAALLFAIGLAGALTRRNAILVLIGIELMLNAANLNLIAFWRYGPHPEALTGMMFAIFSIAVAAAEAAVGLGLVISIHRHAHTTDLDAMNRMKG
jgi:NADH-quinone oxidoreductase subunit K